MRVIVIGANGFIGTNLIHELLKQQIEVVGIDMSDDHLKRFMGNTYFQCVKEPITHKLLTGILKSDDAVICLAAKRLSAEFNLMDYAANVQLNSEIFQSCVDCHTKNVVFLSSISAYRADQEGCKENEDTGAGNLYGESKYSIDHLACYLNDKKDMCIKCLRLAQVIGSGERKGYLLNTLLDNAKAQKQQTIYGTGCGERQYIYIKDVISAIIHAINAKSSKGVYNIGIKGRISIKSLAVLINQVFENEAGINFLIDKPEDKSILEMDVTKAEQELHWKPEYDLEASLRDLKTYY